MDLSISVGPKCKLLQYLQGLQIGNMFLTGSCWFSGMAKKAVAICLRWIRMSMTWVGWSRARVDMWLMPQSMEMFHASLITGEKQVIESLHFQQKKKKKESPHLKYSSPAKKCLVYWIIALVLLEMPKWTGPCWPTWSTARFTSLPFLKWLGPQFEVGLFSENNLDD